MESSLSVLFTALLLLALESRADINLRNVLNNHTEVLDSAPANFGYFSMDMKPAGLVDVYPSTACHWNITRPPTDANRSFIAIVSRGDCAFVLKVVNAQRAGYVGVIVVNYKNQGMLIMGGEDPEILIPSVMTTHSNGLKLRQDYLYKSRPNWVATLDTTFEPFSWHSYLWPFVSVIGVCLVFMGIFMLLRYHREQARIRQRRLPAVDLRRIPTLKFKKSDDTRYETCAICLEDYEDGDKLRVLPCEHAYHCQCIDKWLLSRSRACPVCKSKVQADNDGDDGEDSSSSNSAPAAAAASRRRRRRRPSSAAAGATAAAVANASSDNDSESDGEISAAGNGERVPFVQSLDRRGGHYGSNATSPVSVSSEDSLSSGTANAAVVTSTPPAASPAAAAASISVEVDTIQPGAAAVCDTRSDESLV